MLNSAFMWLIYRCRMFIGMTECIVFYLLLHDLHDVAIHSRFYIYVIDSSISYVSMNYGIYNILASVAWFAWWTNSHEIYIRPHEISRKDPLLHSPLSYFSCRMLLSLSSSFSFASLTHPATWDGFLSFFWRRMPLGGSWILFSQLFSYRLY